MTETAVAPVRSRRVGSVDLVWVALRQHRGLILSTAGALVLLCGYMLWTGLTVSADHSSQYRCEVYCAPLSLLGVSTDQYELVHYETAAVTGVGLLIGMFWAAPLLAAEYERRTSLLAWSQDVRPIRWLVGKVVPMAVIAAALAAGTGELANWVGDRIRDVSHDYYSKFEHFNFEAFGPVQVGYAVFGFALGLLASAVFRRVLPALAATGVVFVAARWAIYSARPYYQTPVRSVDRGVDHVGYLSRDNLFVDSGWASANGQPVDFNGDCGPEVMPSGADYENCLHAHGIIGRYTDYQPVGRLLTFRMIEAGIFVGLAAVLFALTWLRVRRQGSVTA